MPKIRDDLVVEDFGDELVVCNARPGGYSDVHHLNPSAAVVFRLCDGTATPDDLAAEVADAYSLSVEAVQKDVRKVVRQFRQQALLTVKPVVRRPRSEQEQPDQEHEHDHEHSENGHQAADERQLIRDQEPEHD